MVNKLLFRLWNKNNEKMYYPGQYPNEEEIVENLYPDVYRGERKSNLMWADIDGLHIPINGGGTPALLDECGRYEWFNNEIIIMQYTGVEDKYGNFIYDEDIIDIDKEGKAKVIARPGKFTAETLEFGKYTAIFAVDEILAPHCEVIGNVYENPELLPLNN